MKRSTLQKILRASVVACFIIGLAFVVVVLFSKGDDRDEYGIACIGFFLAAFLNSLSLENIK